MYETCILLSTYNGEKYLGDFLKSLLSQTYRNWTLFVRDDGSKDRTLHILMDFEKSYKEKIHILYDGYGNLGAGKSFLTLLKSVPECMYYVFADQDDVWLEYKLEESLKRMANLEASVGEHIPLLVHSDLVVVDERLRKISNSLWKYQHIKPYKNSLNYLLLQNTVTGCTAVINNALRKLVKEIPQKAIVHDWWIALIASAFGRIEPIEKPTVLYRQHSSNYIGARKYYITFFLYRFFKERDFAKKSLIKAIKQAEEFLSMYYDLLSDSHKKLIENFVKIPKVALFERLSIVIKNNFYKHGFIRNLGLFTVLFSLKRYEC